jgi:hypothetical protein
MSSIGWKGVLSSGGLAVLTLFSTAIWMLLLTIIGPNP